MVIGRGAARRVDEATGLRRDENGNSARSWVSYPGERVSGGRGDGVGAADGNDGNVVGLAELFRGFDDGGGGLGGDGLGAIEAEQLALFVLRFYYAVGVERQAAAVREMELFRLVGSRA